MKTKKSRHSSVVSIWPSSCGRVGSEYGIVSERPQRLLIWIRQAADADKRGRLIDQFRRTHARLESLTLSALKPVFVDLSRKVLERFAKADSVAVQAQELFHPAELAVPFNHAMKPAWLRGCETGINFEATWAGASQQQLYVPSHQQREVPSINVDMSAFLQKSVLDWLKLRTEGVWSEVGRTIHMRLEATLKRGLADGRTLKEMTADIQKTLRSIEEYQAKRIARTETTGSMNFGGHAERVDLGIEHKEWVSTMDGRTRGVKIKDRYDHISTNGQTILNSEPFQVSGQKMLYPADGSYGASAGNICNCRCTAVGAWPDNAKPKPIPPVPPVPPPKPPKPKPPKPEKKPEPEAKTDTKPKNWDEPHYDVATIPSSPMPHRTPPPPNAKLAERDQYRNFVRMDEEQRSAETVGRINLVRQKLTAQNQGLEEARQRLLDANAKVEAAQADLDKAIEKLHALMRNRAKKKFMDAAENELNAARDKLHAVKAKTAISIFDAAQTTAKADIVFKIDPKISATERERCTEAGKWFANILSDKHGKTVEVPVDLTKNARAFFSPANGSININNSTPMRTIVHEIGHLLEEKTPTIHDLCKGFLYHRTGIERAEYCGAGEISEVGLKDDWTKVFGNAYSARYTGKYYFGATEILSKGLEQMLDSPIEFAKKDPEYFKFMLGILRGDLL